MTEKLDYDSPEELVTQNQEDDLLEMGAVSGGNGSSVPKLRKPKRQNN